MSYYHGIKTTEVSTSVTAPEKVQTGITFAVGTAPVYMGNGGVNNVILANSYDEAVAALGYSDDWETFTLCAAIKTYFKLYKVKPVVFVNVFDPAKHKVAVEATELQLVNKQASLPDTAILSSLVVKATADGNALTAGTDYEAFYYGGKLMIEAIDGGAITGTSIYVSYDKADISSITEADIIGGVDTDTNVKTGFELVNSVFSKCGVIPELLIAPGWSSNPTVAAIMATKAAAVSELFKGKAIVDADCTTITKYTDVAQWKEDNKITDSNTYLCWPMVMLDGKKYHMSIHAAALTAAVDASNDGIPSESPSNKALQIDSTVLADGTEIVMELSEVNALNGKGIATAFNFGGRFVLWGNETACFPDSTEPKDYFLAVNRMFGFVAQHVILSHWSKIDGKITRRLIDAVVDETNIWLGALKASEHIYGGRVEFSDDDNSTEAISSGKLVFRIYLAPPSPAKEMEFKLEYDASYIAEALGG